ncbi:MAG TPA: KpsF/GutQ family sugar-phosphate isomerase [Planctomycetota bacterium]|jgi:arabinose-5-phosphate isomerase|nr:KpsF/GutQ family sugar-phosphate isomerase [Planctomycetota bacterium]
MNRDKGREILKIEAEAVLSLAERLGKEFDAAIDVIVGCKGHLVVTGMGKSGLVGQKISATFASTGTPSIFLHPAEAYHGDLGRVLAPDVVLAISNSGETEEVVRLLPSLKQIGAKLVAITASKASTLGKNADIVIELGRIEEACPLKLAPSATTTAILALGDALALCVLESRGFDKEQFSFFHPGGDLGRKLLKVSDVMRTGERNPVVREETPLTEAIAAITRARTGSVSIIDGSGKLTGIFTDGDLRRAMSRDTRLFTSRIGELMTRNPKTIPADRLASEALKILHEKKLDELPVVNEKGEPVGLIDVQDLLDVGVV